jgi:hypothetical protein
MNCIQKRSTAVAVGWCTVFALLVLAGCSQAPGRVAVPDYDPAAIATGVLTEFDQNQDGQLRGAEIQKLQMLMRHDTNQDKSLSGEELQAIVQKWIDDRAGRCDLSSRVTFDGRPLVGADVSYQPLSAFGELLPSGTGTTDQTGAATIASASDGGPPKSGMPCGFYRVVVKAAGSGKSVTYDPVFEVSSLDTNIHNIQLTSSATKSH